MRLARENDSATSLSSESNRRSLQIPDGSTSFLDEPVARRALKRFWKRPTSVGAKEAGVWRKERVNTALFSGWLDVNVWLVNTPLLVFSSPEDYYKLHCTTKHGGIKKRTKQRNGCHEAEYNRSVTEGQSSNLLKQASIGFSRYNQILEIRIREDRVRLTRTQRCLRGKRQICESDGMS